MSGVSARRANAKTRHQFRPNRYHRTSIWQEIGIPSRGAALNRTILQGLRYDVLVTLASKAGFEAKEMGRLLGISRSTLLRREKEGHFNQAESDRLYRMAKVHQAAIDLFEGDKRAACHWLRRPVKGLGNARPVDLLKTMAGTETVLNLIGRLEYGVPA
jgi:putative toxin-antitoxin system antitoxin component (TIGR02293 family)